MLIDKDSKPKDTILYLSTLLLRKIKAKRRINISLLETLYQEVDDKQPIIKFILALNFLFLLNKVDVIEEEIIYVLGEAEDS